VFSQVRAGCPGSRALGGAESQGQAGHGNRTAPAEFELAADNMTEMGDWGIMGSAKAIKVGKRQGVAHNANRRAAHSFVTLLALLGLQIRYTFSYGRVTDFASTIALALIQIRQILATGILPILSTLQTWRVYKIPYSSGFATIRNFRIPSASELYGNE